MKALVMKASIAILQWKYFGAAVVAAGALALSTPGHASEQVNFLNASGSSNVTVTYFNGSRIVTEGTSAGAYQFSDGGGRQYSAFCTDPFDSIYYGETWDATRVLTSSAQGLSSATYPEGPFNVRAIDFIGQNYTTGGSHPAAQVAVWDLVVGGHVTYDSSTGVYTYDAGKFSADGVSIADVYSIEQKALQSKGIQGSYLLKQVNGSQPGYYGRPQDLVTYNPNPPAPVPEPSAPQMALCLAAGFGIVFGASRKRKRFAARV